MIASFLDHIHIKGKLIKCSVLLIGMSLLYSVLYEIVMPVIYQSDHAVLFYGATGILTLFTCCMAMVIVGYFVSIKQATPMMSIRHSLLPCILSFTILIVGMLGLGMLSFQLALQDGQGVFAYVVNAVLVIACMLYFPVGIFAILEIIQGNQNPFKILARSVSKLVHHYQSVFYTCVLIAIFAFGYRYLMNTFYSFQLGVALYDLPLELLTRCVPFLDIPGIVMVLLDNTQAWGALLLSFGYQLLLSIAYVFFIFYMICIHDEDISV